MQSPFSTSRIKPRPTRAGFTLIEMLLVLGVLAVIAAISYPGLQRMWTDHKIQEAAEMVRSNLAGTRNKSIDAVLIYEFRYELGGTHFLVIPHEPDRFESDDPADALGQSGNGGELYRAVGELRPDVIFAAVVKDTSSLGIPVIEQEQPIAQWQIAGLPEADQLKGLRWSAPLLFYPDGSAMQSVLRLEDESGQQMELTVRGLTGAVSAARVQKETGL